MSRDLAALGGEEATAGDWILSRLHPHGEDVGSIVPSGFEAYCRVFHPVVPPDPCAPLRTWTEVANEHGRIPHRQMQFHMIDRPPGSPAPAGDARDERLAWGSLPIAERIELVELLRQYTATPERCSFAVWSGHPDVPEEGARRLRHPARDYLVFEGPIDAVVGSPPASLGSRSPNLWWPEDRRWIVVTDVEFAWTYVGGPAHLVEDLLSHRSLEVMRCELSDRPYSDGDLLNASLDE